ncbi:MAG: hypothetical protein SGILL_007391 [Bacillariaceae sp.]
MLDDSDHAAHNSGSAGRPPFIPSLNGDGSIPDDGLDRNSSHHSRNVGGGGSGGNFFMELSRELMGSSELLFNNKLNWLLLLGPLALVGDATGFLGEAACFAFSGIALIPCAERLSFVTEQVAEHTNGTIGALLNATFGNAPELLIATAALRSGFYRVVQLAMLGSMLTNLLFVFGISCLVGGLRWQVQELRITSGNVSVGMLLLSTAGSLLPATLVLGGQLRQSDPDDATTTSDSGANSIMTPSKEELQFCRVNAFVMMFMYGCYLVFQLGTHKEEFDEDENVVQTANDNPLHMSPHFTSRHGRQAKARRNLFCMGAMRRARALRMCGRNSNRVEGDGWMAAPGLMGGDVEMARKNTDEDGFQDWSSDDDSDDSDSDGDSSSDEGNVLLPQNETLLRKDETNGYFDDYDDPVPIKPLSDMEDSFGETSSARQRRSDGSRTGGMSPLSGPTRPSLGTKKSKKKKKRKKKNKKSSQRPMLPLGLADPLDGARSIHIERPHAQMSFRAGIMWLFIITLGISAMSDILVDTIDGFAARLHISEVFTSMVIVPFFSNVAEQVSAVLFAYRNEMDLCVGVTVGSAIQVATFVLPGCVIIGWLVDRSMTLFFHTYETMCLFLSVIVIAAVLQGGTTNWLVGATCVSVYVMIATGFWFHSLEDLSVDAESIGQNATVP